jgi:RimJ/RimL family protein N-acetyltransferase
VPKAPPRKNTTTTRTDTAQTAWGQTCPPHWASTLRLWQTAAALTIPQPGRLRSYKEAGACRRCCSLVLLPYDTVPRELETPRLALRMFEEADWQPLHEMFSDDECVRYTIQTPLADWQTWRALAGYLGHWHLRGYGPYAVVEKSTKRMMGPVGLWAPGEWPEPEIKWSLARRFWGNGYATEAALAVRAMAARDLKWERLVSLVAPENQRSKAVAKRLGGTFEKTIPFRGSLAEVFVYNLRLAAPENRTQDA